MAGERRAFPSAPALTRWPRASPAPSPQCCLRLATWFKANKEECRCNWPLEQHLLATGAEVGKHSFKAVNNVAADLCGDPSIAAAFFHCDVYGVSGFAGVGAPPAPVGGTAGAAVT